MNQTISAPRPRRGWTLIEVLVVVVIVGIVGITAVPSLRSVSAAQHAGAASTVASTLRNARDRALAEGRPHGVQLMDAGSGDAIWHVVIETAGAAPTGARGIDGVVSTPADLTNLLPLGFIEQIEIGAAVAASETIWFDEQGRPHSRTPGGAFSAFWTQPRTITIAGGGLMLVHERTGRVEQP